MQVLPYIPTLTTVLFVIMAGTYKPENMFLFDQTPYFSGQISVDQTGFVYIPSGCADHTSECKLHVAIHGCNMGRYFVNSTFAENSGLNEWGESNNIIVLYPNVLPDDLVGNPDGCWDWWGYLGPDYALQSGPQMAFIKSIIDEVIGK